MAVHDLNFPDEKFDGFWTAATLLHIPKELINSALNKIKEVLRPGAYGFISVKAGAGERTDPDTGRWFAYYSLKDLHDILKKNGFEIVEEGTRKGERDTWLTYWVKNR